MDNSVGQIVEMERHEVNDNKDQTCSTGLHFCGMSYLSNFGGERTVIVKVNPADVVSIPSDYNDAKGRACRYEVIGELNVNPEDAFTKPVQSTAVGSKPVHAGPKLGNSAFYAGYSAGFQASYNATDDQFGKDRLNYREGYEKGTDDRLYSGNERYRYTSTPVQSAAWPFPTKG
jgi:hypothetical protein